MSTWILIGLTVWAACNALDAAFDYVSRHQAPCHRCKDEPKSHMEAYCYWCKRRLD